MSELDRPISSRFLQEIIKRIKNGYFTPNGTFFCPRTSCWQCEIRYMCYDEFPSPTMEQLKPYLEDEFPEYYL